MISMRLVVPHFEIAQELVVSHRHFQRRRLNHAWCWPHQALPTGRGRKPTYDRYEVGLKAVEVQGVPGRESVVRGSGRARHRDRGEKPHKTGCRCPQCGRRGKIVRTMKPRRCGETCACAGGPSGCITASERSAVRRMADAWPTPRRSPLGGAGRPGDLPFRIPPAQILSGHAAKRRRADVGPRLLDPVRTPCWYSTAFTSSRPSTRPSTKSARNNGGKRRGRRIAKPSRACAGSSSGTPPFALGRTPRRSRR
jgi:hypothetical protein